MGSSTTLTKPRQALKIRALVPMDIRHADRSANTADCVTPSITNSSSPRSGHYSKIAGHASGTGDGMQDRPGSKMRPPYGVSVAASNQIDETRISRVRLMACR